MAFEGLTEKLQGAFKKLSGKGKLTEADVKLAMREVRMALLEADVNFTVVKDFIKKLTERCVGTELRKRQADLFSPAADDLHALRPAGRRQDHDGCQAGQHDQEGRQEAAARSV